MTNGFEGGQQPVADSLLPQPQGEKLSSIRARLRKFIKVPEKEFDQVR